MLNEIILHILISQRHISRFHGSRLFSEDCLIRRLFVRCEEKSPLTLLWFKRAECKVLTQDPHALRRIIYLMVANCKLAFSAPMHLTLAWVQRLEEREWKPWERIKALGVNQSPGSEPCEMSLISDLFDIGRAARSFSWGLWSPALEGFSGRKEAHHHLLLLLLRTAPLLEHPFNSLSPCLCPARPQKLSRLMPIYSCFLFSLHIISAVLLPTPAGVRSHVSSLVCQMILLSPSEVQRSDRVQMRLVLWSSVPTH